MILEACVNSTISAIEAQKGSADRIELCENLLEGGTTPSAGSIRIARKHLKILIMVMIRPRGSDFLYSDTEYDIMKEDIVMAKELGADGVVLGILNPDATVDVNRCRELIKLAHPMQVTFHRAFDMTSDPFKALDDLIMLKVDRVLTSGQKENAHEGAKLIADLIRYADGRICIMPGGGLNEENLRQVIKTTGATDFHVYLTHKINSKMIYRNSGVFMGDPENPEYELEITDPQRMQIAKSMIF